MFSLSDLQCDYRNVALDSIIEARTEDLESLPLFLTIFFCNWVKNAVFLYPAARFRKSWWSMAWRSWFFYIGHEMPQSYRLLLPNFWRWDLSYLKSNKSFRPVKVTAASSTVVTQIIAKSENLWQSEKFQSVLIIPDRSPEQRIKQRELVNGI